MFTDASQNRVALPTPGIAGYLEAPAANSSTPEIPSLGAGRYEQALNEVRKLPDDGSETTRRTAQLLMWEIGMIATARDYANSLPADVRAEREPMIQAARRERAARREHAPLTWAEWEASRESRRQELAEWEATMAAELTEMKSYIPQDIQDERASLLAKRYAARRAERARIAADLHAKQDTTKQISE